MKHLFALLLTLPVLAGTIEVDYYDQLKLSEFLSTLDSDLKVTTRVNLTKPLAGVQIRDTLQSDELPFSIQCDRNFYNGSPFPSKVNCVVSVYPEHEGFARKNNEIRIKMMDERLAQAMYAAIPYGEKKRKRLYSFYRDVGTLYNGEWSNVFHFYFDCSLKECVVSFSHLKHHE
jgi:hypothetical protein